VYFSVADAPDYGRLSGARLEEMVSQETSELKRDQRDFALWKSQKAHEDAAWESPWGPGRPGWHIECSAMAEKFLGHEFEIHGGGLDLRFPHHENELAQSSALGHRFAHVWMHNGMLELDAEKMSKSLGNVVTLRNVLDTWGREALLVFHLTGHWSKPADFSDETMEAASARAEGFREVFRGGHEPAPAGDRERFAAALDDDFNTPAALAVMHEWRDHDLLRRALGTFGLESLADDDHAPAELVALARRRVEARQAREFDEADRLRAEIEAEGWDVRDEAEGFRLVRRR
jgi:cysteinyl-tRNA synthetase